MRCPEAKLLKTAQANESLAAVVAGLKIGEDDVVLSVGCSGDYAFRLLAESPKEIYVVDKVQAQMDYIAWRKKALKWRCWKAFAAADKRGNGDYHTYADQKQERDDYFLNGENCKVIAERLERLVLLPAQDIFKLRMPGRFSRVFLSNAYEYMWEVQEAGRNVSEGGIMYCSYQLNLMPHRFSTIYWGARCPLPQEEASLINGNLTGGLFVDVELTNQARSLEHNPWSPVVLRKQSRRE